MKLDCDLIRKLRKDAAWSQEDLAAASGLSLRTIQRVETDGVAALETRRALAAAFRLDANDLEKGDPANDPRVLKIALGILALWVGAAWLFKLGWGIALTGVGVLIIFSQVWRARVDKLQPAWEWGGVGILCLVGGLNLLLGLDLPLGPLSVVIAGALLIFSARKSKT